MAAGTFCMRILFREERDDQQRKALADQLAQQLGVEFTSNFVAQDNQWVLMTPTFDNSNLKALAALVERTKALLPEDAWACEFDMATYMPVETMNCAVPAQAG